MYNLIKNNTIQFDKLVIEKYYKLNIDEIDAIILIRLNDLLRRGKRLLSVEEIAPTMIINEAELGKRIVDLVKRGFITLELSTIDAKEIFSLDETYRRLGYLLEDEKQMQNDSTLNIKMKETVILLEKELKKTLSPLELEMVSRWYLEYKYTDDEIDTAIIKALKYKNRGVNFIDRSLSSSRKNLPTQKEKPLESSGENIQDLFKKIYANSK